MRGTFLEVEHPDKTKKVDFSIIGINFCSAPYLEGVEYGADSLRKSSFRYGNADGSSLPLKVFSPERGYILKDTNLSDYGNITATNLKDLENKLKMLDLAKLGIPIFIGSDHSVSYYLIKKILSNINEDIIVFQFDAHSDFIGEYDEYPHGSVMNKTSELKHVKKIIHFGLRGNLNSGPALENSRKKGNIIVPYINIQDDFYKVLNEIKNKAIYVTFDTDFLNPIVAPATDNPEPGGPVYEDAIIFIQKIIENAKIVVGMDFVEYNPKLDGSSVTSATLVNIIMESLGFLTKKNIKKEEK